MNCFSTFSGASMRATSNPNSLSTIIRSAKNITRDLSGLNIIDLSATSSYHISAAGLNTTNTNTSQALLKFNNRALAVSDFSSTGSYTIVIKHAASQSSLPPFNFFYPNVVKLSSVYTAINQDFSAQFYSSLSPGTVVPYSITGIPSSSLNGAALSGTFTAPYRVIPYRVTTAPTASVFYNVSGGLSTAYYTYDPTVLSVNGLVSIVNTSSRTVSAAYTQNSGLANLVNATYGLQFQGTNYIIYGTNNVSQIALGTRPFFISTTLRFTTTVADQFVLSTSKEGSRHGLVVHFNGSTLRVQMYNSSGQYNERAYAAAINVDNTLTIERTATSYICIMNGNLMTSGGNLAENYFGGAVDCGSSAIRLGGMTYSTNGSAATGNNNGYLWSGYIKNFLLRF